MSKVNLLVVLNAYSDSRSSNAPNLTNFKWSRDIQGIDSAALHSESLVVAAGATVTLFSVGAALKFLYLECDQTADLVINGTINESVKPLVVGSGVSPGLFMRTSDITSLTIHNTSASDANVFFATIK